MSQCKQVLCEQAITNDGISCNFGRENKIRGLAEQLQHCQTDRFSLELSPLVNVVTAFIRLRTNSPFCSTEGTASVMKGQHVYGCAALLWTKGVLHFFFLKKKPEKPNAEWFLYRVRETVWLCNTLKTPLTVIQRRTNKSWLCLLFEIRACWGHLSATAISQPIVLIPLFPFLLQTLTNKHTARTQSGPISNSRYATADDATRRNQRRRSRGFHTQHSSGWGFI